jgi:hypothetical protein
VVFDINQALQQAEEFLRRNIKSKAVRAAEKRRRERQAREVARRLKRSAAVMGASGASIVGYGVAIAPVGGAGLVAACAATVVAAAATLFWPSRKTGEGRPLAEVDAGELVLAAEDWLLRKRAVMPVRTLPALDTILARLHDLHPHLAGLDPTSLPAGDVRRLIGGHLPRLIDSYLSMPSTARDPQAERGLIEDLGTLAEEITRLCHEIGRDSLFTFETQRRFIESRYRRGGLPGD